jgi:hypothetical protein
MNRNELRTLRSEIEIILLERDIKKLKEDLREG